MKKRLFFSLITLLSVFSSRAYDFKVDGIYYNIMLLEFVDKDEVAVTYEEEHVPSYFGSVVIPATVTYEGVTYSVGNIGEKAFYDCRGLTSVVIPESVTSIRDFAFVNCSGLTTVVIPDNVTGIGFEAFFHCFGIRNPLYNGSVFAYMPTNYSGEYVIPSGIQTISGGAFGECRDLTSITIPESVTSIGMYAFSRCSGLTSVTSWAKRPPICGRWVFEDCGDATLYVPYGSKTAYAEGEWKTFSKIKEIATVTAQANDETMGSVIGGGQYKIDEKITLEAIPNDGYHFEKWDDGNTDNPRLLTVTCDVVLTAMFTKDVPTPPTANESALSAAPIAYVQGRTAYLADGLGEVEAFTSTGQRVYRGFDRTVTLPRPGVYILRVVPDGRRCKVVVR